MRFALLYCYDPSQTGPTEGEVADWLAFDKAVRDAGVFVDEAGFQPVDRARTVSVRDGALTVEDGGMDATEVIAGFFVLDVADADAAVDWAKRIPTASYGRVEVRPVVEFEA